MGRIAKLLIFIVLIATVFSGVSSLNAMNLWKLAQGGRQVVGTVTEIRPQDHYTAVYQYRVGTQQFVGTSPVTPSMHLKPGDTITVTYLPADETVSALGDVATRLVYELIASALVSIVIAVIPVYGLDIRRAWTPRRKQL
jgi:hypothetical protein